MPRRALRATLLLWLVLIFIAWNAIRVWTAIAWRNVLADYSTRPDPIYLAISGAIWVVLGGIIMVGIFQRRTWSGKGCLGLAIAYAGAYWIERSLWQAASPNWPFTLILQLALLTFTYYSSVFITREAYERGSPDKKTG